MSLFELLEKVVAAEGEEAEVKLPEEEINLLSLKILKREAERRGKKLKLKASGPRGKRLIVLLEEGVEPEPIVIRGRFKLPRPRLSFAIVRRIGLIPLLLFGILLLLGGGGYWGLNYFPRAEIFLTLNPMPMVKDIPVSVSTEATEIDVENGVIPGAEVSVEEEGQKSTPATGTATVGEKAKGTVIFKNCGDVTPPGPHVSKNTLITTLDGKHSFIVDAALDVLVKEVGGDCVNSSPVGVTAASIGEAYNLSKDTIFSVQGFTTSVLTATSTIAFSGGESRQVKVVASADQAKVLDELKKELVEKGKIDLVEQAGLDQVVIQKAIKQEVVEQNFLQEVGEQADEVSLTLKMKFTIIVYKEGDLQDFISQALADRVPENYEIYPGEMGIETLEPKLSKNTLGFSAEITAQIIPKLDLEGIKNELAGRDAVSAQEYLASLSNITAYELRLWPNLPENLRRIPRSTERIRIELQTETEEELLD